MIWMTIGLQNNVPAILSWQFKWESNDHQYNEDY